MDLMLQLLDPETHQVLDTWQSPTLVTALRMKGIDIAAYLPTEALSRDWGTTRLEEHLERHLRGLEETTTPLREHSKREMDLTDEDREEIAQATSQRHITRNDYAVVEWESHVPQQDPSGTLARDKGEVETLLAFLKRGREEGALLDNSLYPVGEAQAAGEPSVPTTTSFLSSPSHRAEPISSEATELSPAVLQQNQVLDTPGNVMTEGESAEDQQQEEPGDDPSVTAESYPENVPIFAQEEQNDEQSAIRQQDQEDEENLPVLAYSDPGEE